MPRVTVPLLRKRAEHNDGCLSTLEEITLHQQDLECIELVQEECRFLRILMLQNNLISRIENIHKLKRLQYLNLAINSITRLEGLNQLESLEKLDLTLNFVRDLTPLGPQLAHLHHFRHLYLVGNPCEKVDGFRAYVAHVLPNLETLDGKAIGRSERLRAAMDAEPCRLIMEEEAAAFEREEAEKAARKVRGEVDPPRYNEQGERVYGHTPEDRLACALEIIEKQKAAKGTEEKEKEDRGIPPEIRPARKLTLEEEIAKYGRPMMKNEAKLPFRLWDGMEPPPDEYASRFPAGSRAAASKIFLHVEPGRYIATQLIDVQVQPTFVRVDVKGKTLQLLLPGEVTVDDTAIERAKTTGNLLIMMQKSPEMVAATQQSAERLRAGVASLGAESTVPASSVPPRVSDGSALKPIGDGATMLGGTSRKGPALKEVSTRRLTHAEAATGAAEDVDGAEGGVESRADACGVSAAAPAAPVGELA